MDYADVAAAFMGNPSTTDTPDPVEAGSPARRLRDAIEPIAMHSVWNRRTNEAWAARGMDFLSGYVWGRAASLGQPLPEVVVATFAVFEPQMIAGLYAQGQAGCNRTDLLADRDRTTIASLTEVLAGEQVEFTADALTVAVRPAPGVGRALFSGLAAQSSPTDPIGRLWRACELLREHRGDTHVAACAAEGLGPIGMNILTELWVGFRIGEYTSSRGWSEEQISAEIDQLTAKGMLADGQLTAAGRACRERLETQTDFGEQSIVDALGADLDTHVTALEGWSARCVAAGAFPTDLRKRAAG